jgi:hypothetical protein
MSCCKNIANRSGVVTSTTEPWLNQTVIQLTKAWSKGEGEINLMVQIAEYGGEPRPWREDEVMSMKISLFGLC